MRRTTVLGLALAAAAAAGCGKDVQLPGTGSLPTDPGPTGSKHPAVSEPAARAAVDVCLKAATGGHPDRLGQTKVCRARAKGVIEWVVDGQPVVAPATRRIESVWPDRARVEYDVSVGQVRHVALGFHRPIGWLLNRTENGTEEVKKNDTEQEHVVATDVTGQHWIPLYLPLADGRAVVFDAKPAAAEAGPMDQVKLALPGFPTFTLWLDPKTHLIERVLYNRPGLGSRDETHTLVLSHHKEAAGLTLPTKMKYLKNTRLVEDWSEIAWEFPAQIPDTTFDPPAGPKK